LFVSFDRRLMDARGGGRVRGRSAAFAVREDGIKL
jgi:hypothetical protein